MRDSIRLGLIGGALLIVLGLGWYWQHPGGVYEWARTLGRKPPLAADEVIVKQRTTAALPGLDGAVKVRVDDIKRGKTADVEILGPDSVTLASKQGAKVGDQIVFTHHGKKYRVDILRYLDEIGPGDSAKFRILEVDNDDPLPTERPKFDIEGKWKIE